MSQSAKVRLLYGWAENIQRAVQLKKFGRAAQQLSVAMVPGPRVGGLDIHANQDPAALKKAFNEADGLNLAATVPWHFAEGHVNIFSHGKLIRVEAPWPENLEETNIPLRTIRASDDKRFRSGWVAGADENGHLIIPNFFLEAHWGIFGQTGGGKSVALQSAVGQLALASGGSTRFVIIDGKHGEAMSSLMRCPYQIAPPAYDLESAALALEWVLAEMARRYATLRNLDPVQREAWGKETPRLVVVIDEIQTISQDPTMAKMIALLLQQGRAAKINVILSTQYPLNSMMGDPTMKQNLGGRIVLKVNSYDASRVSLGLNEPDATKLLGKGDAYVSASGNFARTQIAYLTRRELAQLPYEAPMMDEWPYNEAAQPTGGSGVDDPMAVAQAILAAAAGEGRPTFKKRLDAVGKGNIGMQKLHQLLHFGRDIYAILVEHRLDIK